MVSRNADGSRRDEIMLLGLVQQPLWSFGRSCLNLWQEWSWKTRQQIVHCRGLS